MGCNKFSAQDVIKGLTQPELEKIFKFFGEEKYSKQIARRIVKYRKYKEIFTEDLVEIINLSKKNFTKRNKATKVFQALRILVNNEVSELMLGLSKSSNLISKNGVIVTVTFHSIEDKICKFFFNNISNINKVSRYLPITKIEDCCFTKLNKKPIIPTQNEIEINPPSRSAKLRAVKRKLTNGIDTEFFFEKFKYLLDVEKIASKL
tara:strand:- start:2 stop:619 length:618 start_codon:yes stop_codon:yes gene_type:complete